MTQGRPENWIEPLARENAKIRWGFSNFAGAKRLYNEEGDHNFTIDLTQTEAEKLITDGWNVRQRPAREEGEPDEYTLKVSISDKFDMPAIYFIRGGRKFPVEYMAELNNIRPNMVSSIDFIAEPGKPWEDEKASIEAGYPIMKRTAYLKEMYVNMVESQLGSKYSDYEEVRTTSD